MDQQSSVTFSFMFRKPKKNQESLSYEESLKIPCPKTHEDTVHVLVTFLAMLEQPWRGGSGSKPKAPALLNLWTQERVSRAASVDLGDTDVSVYVLAFPAGLRWMRSFLPLCTLLLTGETGMLGAEFLAIWEIVYAGNTHCLTLEMLAKTNAFVAGAARGGEFREKSRDRK